MSVELICPDCGGIIGAKDIDSQGRSPCSCKVDNSAEYAATAARRAADSSDTDTFAAPSPDTSAADASKLCIVCGRDVSGHRRIKDSRGYTCYHCAREEVKDERAGKVRCQECRKFVKEDGIHNYKGTRICRSCFNVHKEADDKGFKAVSTEHYVEEEKRGVIILGAIFAVLLIIMIWKTFF